LLAQSEEIWNIVPRLDSLSLGARLETCRVAPLHVRYAVLNLEMFAWRSTG